MSIQRDQSGAGAGPVVRDAPHEAKNDCKFSCCGADEIATSRDSSEDGVWNSYWSNEILRMKLLWVPPVRALTRQC